MPDPYAIMRRTVREIYDHALKEASIAAAFERHVHARRSVLRVCDDLFQLDSHPRIFVVAFGKAAHTMAAALAEQMGAQVSGIVAAPEATLRNQPQVPGFRYFDAGHPLPNSESVKAAEAALKCLTALPEKSLVIYLISGGGSSLLEKPLDNEISLDDLIATYQVLVHSGASIREINVIRKHLSAVKGGRMAEAAGWSKQLQQVSIMVSDVPDMALDTLASGPTMPDSSSTEDCYRIATQYGMTAKFPAAVRELFEHHALEETPDKDDPVFHYARWWRILSNTTAVQAAKEKAEKMGFAVTVDNSCDDWDYAKAADYLLGRLGELKRRSARVCLISGGEVTVEITGEAGTGGRNQQFALYCAHRTAAENITILSAGTDGIDGNSPATGAIADGQTMQRYSQSGTGMSVSDALKTFDAYPVFHALGDAIEIGPTGNNVRDLRVLLGW